MTVDTGRLVDAVYRSLSLGDRPGIASAWLIGSAVSSWREFTESSDVDIVLLFTSEEAMTQFPYEPMNESVRVYSESGEEIVSAPIDIITYEVGEWDPEQEPQKARIA